MGLDIVNTKNKKEMSIGYGHFFWMKRDIINAIAPNFTSEWEDLIKNNGYVTRSFVEKMKELGVYDLIFHSDCDGILDRRSIKRLANSLKDIQYDNEKFEELRDLICDAKDNGGILKFY